MKLFVTGGSGFLGKSFIKEATKKKNFVYLLSRKKKNNYNLKVKKLTGKLNDNWSKYFKKTDVIVHLAAAGVQADKTSKKNILKTNLYDSIKFIKNAVRSGCRKFLIISTSSEYGCISKRIKELNIRSKRNPKNLYSISKVKFTNSIKKLSMEKNYYDCKFRIMRVFPVYGPGENSLRLFPSLKEAAVKGKNFLIKNPLEFRDFSETSYVSKVLLNACIFKKATKRFEIYHVSSNKRMTVIEFAKKLWKKFNAKGKLITENKKVFFSTHVSDKKSVWKINKNVKRK